MRKLKKYKHLIIYTLLTFTLLSLISAVNSYYELEDFKAHDFVAKKSEIKLLMSDMNKIADSIYDNLIDIPKVIDVFKEAHTADDTQKKIIRDRLYDLLKDQYKNFQKYGIQQLHFHLPDNESFLRFHRPAKYGDDLTDVRESVKFVNQYHKPKVGFEEGRIFNGYRYVYPLSDEHGTHLGSVEVSSSLLNFKKMYEKATQGYIDFILTKEVVRSKVFKSQLSNYTQYCSSDDFLIQKNLYDYNKANSRCVGKEAFLHDIFASKRWMDKISKLEPLYILKMKGFELYSIVFIPLLNDFTDEKVGYTLMIDQAKYLHDIFHSEIIYLLLILVLSILIGFVVQFHKALLDSEQRFMMMTSQAPYSISLYDLQGLMIDANDSFEKMWQIPRKEVIGQLNILKDPSIKAQGILDHIRKAYAGEIVEIPPQAFDWVQGTKRQEHSPIIKAWIYPLKDTKGDVTNLVIVHEDMSEIKRKDDLILAQSRHAAMGEMISMIAHQWRQPLSVISMLASNTIVDLELGTLDDDELRAYTEQVIAQTEHLSKTIDDFRDFFRTDFEKAHVSIHDVLKATLEIVNASLTNNDISVEMHVADETPLYIHERELIQVFINLINNAKDALLSNDSMDKSIKITVSKSEGDPMVVICDNGGGIEQQYLTRVFEPYFTTKSKMNGTGLGLYISKIIVDEHLSGSISVENRDGGACFTVTIPENA